MTRPLTLLSLFTGAGGIDLGLERSGMKCVAQCEIEKQAVSVLRRHWPDVKRFDDVRRIRARSVPRVDLVCGGFPCQDVSVAGRRAGLAGERSGLWFEFHRIIRQMAPAWVLIENVPGLLSSHKGADLSTILRGLGELGYGWAYRVLDAQYFGLAQRRQRVWIVGRAGGDFRSAAEVLFERESLPWDSPPSREAGSRVAADAQDGVGSGRGFVADDYRNMTFEETDVARPLTNSPDRSRAAPVVVNCLDAHMAMGGADDNSAQAGHLVATGGAAVSFALTAKGGRFDGESETFIPVAYQCQGTNVGEMGTLRKGDGGVTSGVPFTASRYGVRRLMPIECERLQGLPDGWTEYGVNEAGETVELSDSARYRLIGNGVAIPCIEWIGARMSATS